MDDDAFPAGALTLAAPDVATRPTRTPAPAAHPPVLVRTPGTTDPAPRLDAARARLGADSVALVAWDEDALQVVAVGGARLSGSAAMAVGVACAEVDRRAASTWAVCGSTGPRDVYVARLTREGARTLALVAVAPRTLPDPSADAVGTVLLEAFAAA